MAKTEMIGVVKNKDDRGPMTKREDYRAPKLTVVGTVADLTRGLGNEGNPDGPIFQTAGGG